MPGNNGMEVISIVDPEGGGLGGFGGVAIAGTLVIGAIATIGMLLIKAQEKAALVAAEKEWARAAALQARADMIDARTAQIAVVGQGILPILFAIFGALCFAAIIVGVLYFLDRRARERQELFLLQQQLQQLQAASQLYMPQTDWQGVGDGISYRSRQENVARNAGKQSHGQDVCQSVAVYDARK